MTIKQIATELETRALNNDIINKRFSNTGFNMLCNTLKGIEAENNKTLSMADVEFLYNYIDLSKYY